MLTLAYQNPYTGLSGVESLLLFFKRILTFMLGGFHLKNLASDEQQILILLAIAVSGAITGSLLIFRKMTMLANALSHTVLFGIVITFLLLKTGHDYLEITSGFSVMLLAALITGFLTIVLVEILARTNKLQKDAAIGLVFTGLFASGILLITVFSRNAHVGIELIMGNIDAMHRNDIPPVLWMALCNLIFILLFIRGLKITTFDAVFSKLQGFHPSLFKYLIILQLSLTIVGSFRAVGVVLVLGFLIVPPLIARFFAKSLQMLIVIAMIVGCCSATAGVFISRHILSIYEIPLSTSGVTVCTLYGLYLIVFLSFALRNFLQNSPTLQQFKMKFLTREN